MFETKRVTEFSIKLKELIEEYNDLSREQIAKQLITTGVILNDAKLLERIKRSIGTKV